MQIQEKYKLFEEDLSQGWERYSKLLDELNKYRGKEIGDDAPRVNEILLDIQKSFHEIHPHLSFIVKNFDFARQALKSYEQFIDDIKRAGATPETEIKA